MDTFRSVLTVTSAVLGACAAAGIVSQAQTPPVSLYRRKQEFEGYYPSSGLAPNSPEPIRKRSSSLFSLSSKAWARFRQEPSLARPAAAFEARDLRFRPELSFVKVRQADEGDSDIGYLLGFDNDETPGNGAWFIAQWLILSRGGRIIFRQSFTLNFWYPISEGMTAERAFLKLAEDLEPADFQPAPDGPARLMTLGIALLFPDSDKPERFDPEYYQKAISPLPELVVPVHTVAAGASYAEIEFAIEPRAWRQFIEAPNDVRAALLNDLISREEIDRARFLLGEIQRNRPDQAVDLFVQWHRLAPSEDLSRFVFAAAPYPPSGGFPDVQGFITKVGAIDPPLKELLVDKLREIDPDLFWSSGGFRYAQTISTRSEHQERTGRGITIVDYSADWCGACKNMAPHFDVVAREFQQKGSPVEFYSYPLDEEPKRLGVDITDFTFETYRRFEITNLPQIHIYRDGKLVGSASDRQTRATIRDFIVRTLGLNPQTLH